MKVASRGNRVVESEKTRREKWEGKALDDDSVGNVCSFGGEIRKDWEKRFAQEFRGKYVKIWISPLRRNVSIYLFVYRVFIK